MSDFDDDEHPERTKDLDPEMRKRIEDFELRGISTAGWSDEPEPPIVKLLVMADYCSSGIWAFREGRQYSPMIEYEALSLPPELVARFSAWQEAFDMHQAVPTAFDTDGRDLAAALKRSVGPEIRVVYRSTSNDEEVEIREASDPLGPEADR